MSFQEFDSMISTERKAILKNIDNIYMYCSKKEIELLFKIANSTASIAFKIKNLSSEELSGYLLEYQDINRHVISKLIRTF